MTRCQAEISSGGRWSHFSRCDANGKHEVQVQRRWPQNGEPLDLTVHVCGVHKNALGRGQSLNVFDFDEMAKLSKDTLCVVGAVSDLHRAKQAVTSTTEATKSVVRELNGSMHKVGEVLMTTIPDASLHEVFADDPEFVEVWRTMQTVFAARLKLSAAKDAEHAAKNHLAQLKSKGA